MQDAMLGSQDEVFRSALSRRLAGYTIEGVGSVAFCRVAEYAVAMPILVLALAAQTGGLLAVGRLARASPRWARGFICWELCWHAVGLYALGDMRIIVLPAVGFLGLVNPGTDLARWEHYLIAGFFAVVYFAIVELEAMGVLPRVSVGGPFELRGDFALHLTIVMFLILLVSALYVSTIHEQFVQNRRTLEDRVRARTAELERKHRALQESQRELRELAQIVSHDLQNPVNSIRLTADLAREDAEVGRPPNPQHLGRILVDASRLRTMIGDLLNLFQVTALRDRVEAVDLKEVIQEQIQVLAPIAQAKGVAVEMGPMLTVRGDRRKLGYLFGNLIANAVKFAPSGVGFVYVVAKQAGTRAHVLVRDNGIGIPRQYLGRVFRLYGKVPDHERQVDGVAPPGTGVGLAIVRRLAERMGGAVRCASRRDVGTSFVVRLPSALRS